MFFYRKIKNPNPKIDAAAFSSKWEHPSFILADFSRSGKSNFRFLTKNFNEKRSGSRVLQDLDL